MVVLPFNITRGRSGSPVVVSPFNITRGRSGMNNYLGTRSMLEEKSRPDIEGNLNNY